MRGGFGLVTIASVLERLDEVPWAELTHAYGSAADVPDQLRALAGHNREARDEALHALYGNLFHQGTRYEASGHAIPFLVEMLEAEDVDHKSEILEYITALVAGYFNVQELPLYHDGTALIEWGRARAVEDIETEDEDRMYLDALERTYARAAEHIDVFTEQLGSPEPQARAAAAHLLACFSLQAERLGPVLAARMEVEDDPRVRACLAFALGYHRSLPTLQRIMADDPHPLVRIHAAMALVDRDPSPAALDALLSGLGADIAEAQGLPCSGGELDGDIAAVLARLPPSVIEPGLPRLFQALARARSFATIPIVWAILRATFDERPDDPIRADEVTEPQRLTLSAMVETQDMWSIGNLFSTLRQYGLPSTRDGVAELAGASYVHDPNRELIANARLMAKMGFEDKALDKFEAALEARADAFDAAPDAGTTWLYYGTVLARDPDRRDDAIEALRQAATRLDNPSHALINRGVLLGQAGRRDEQIDGLRQVLDRDPTHIEAWHHQGIALLRAGRLDEAAEATDRAVQLDPRHTHALWNAACVRAQQGELDEAIGFVRRALELDDTLGPQLLDDPDLAPLRDRLDFRRLVAPARSNG